MSSFTTKFMKLVLAEVDAAFLKAATPVADVPVPEFETAEAARDHFRTLFMAEITARLSPEPKAPKAKSASPKSEAKTPKVKKSKKTETAVVEVPVTKAADVPLPSSPKADGEKKKRAPMTEEAKAAMKAKREATKAAKAGSPSSAKSESPAPEAKTPKTKKAKSPKAETPKAESPKEDGEKKKRAPMTEEAKAAMKAKREATKAAKAASPATTEESNLKKVDPTWKKHLKTVAKAQSKEVTKEMEAELLSFLNRLTKEEFAGKKAEEHVAEFLAPSGASNAAAEQKAPVDLEIVEFNGKDYFVNPETKRVYEGEGKYDDDTGAWTSYKPVGYVGMAAFAEMKLE